MANPLGPKPRPAAASGKLKVGETMIIQIKDKAGVVMKEVLFTRTDQPYVHDLCDAYNRAMTQEQIDRGLLWIVSAGQLRIVIDSHWTDEHSAKLRSEPAGQKLPPFDQKFVDSLSPEMLRLGVKLGYVAVDKQGRRSVTPVRPNEGRGWAD